VVPVLGLGRLPALPQDDEALHDGGEGRVLLGGELGPLPVRQEDRRRVGLEAGDGLGVAGLADDVHGHADAHRHRQRRENVVKRG
jgi:hypothetical protein